MTGSTDREQAVPQKEVQTNQVCPDLSSPFNTETPYPFAERIRIPIITKDMWSRLNIRRVLFVCQANLGRSLMAKEIAKKAIHDGVLPEFSVTSAAIDPRFSDRQSNHPFGLSAASPQVVIDVLQSHGHEIYRHQSESLISKSVDHEVDVVALVNDGLIASFITNYPHTHKFKSFFGINMPDPSIILRQATFEQQVDEVYKMLSYIIKIKLPGMIYNQRRGLYSDTPERYGVIHPFDDQPPARHSPLSHFL